MTAPGDSVLLLILLALFLACCGYAAGRLHQRYQTWSDREEAYRDGYDTATRSVFSLAARVVGPRRSSTRAVVPAQSVSPENGPEPSAPAPAMTPPATPKVEDPPVGFPVPPPPPAHVVAEPPAAGGVNYRPFPDPRPVDGSAPLLGPSPKVSRHDAFGVKNGAPAEKVDAPSAKSGVPAGRSGDAEPVPDAESSGRHTVPDALIDGTTYRLPPDRIFRAKVAGANLPDDPTTRIAVPKPRES